MKEKIKVTIWNEYVDEKEYQEVRKIYPEGIHHTIYEFLSESSEFDVRTAVLDDFEHGLAKDIIDSTDVLIWWGHMAHNLVDDEIVNRVYNRVLDGMGLIVLHSALQSKISMKLLGTSCELKWREVGEKERVWVVDRGHPVASGLGEYFEVPNSEMYGEPCDIPAPDKLVFISWYAGGEVFRSGCCYYRGAGKIFYFSPGHEWYPIYHQPEIQTVIINAIEWAVPTKGVAPRVGSVNAKPLENIL